MPINPSGPVPENGNLILCILTVSACSPWCVVLLCMVSLWSHTYNLKCQCLVIYLSPLPLSLFLCLSLSLSLHVSPFNHTGQTLTVDNILNELKDVDWGNLCGVLQLPHSQQTRIESKYDLEDRRRKEAVLFWLKFHPYASWRLLVKQLDDWEEHSVASILHSYAKEVPQSGMYVQSYCFYYTHYSIDLLTLL